jgi:hypothetical protein
MKLFYHVVYNNLFDGVLIYEAQTLYKLNQSISVLDICQRLTQIQHWCIELD